MFNSSPQMLNPLSVNIPGYYTPRGTFAEPQYSASHRKLLKEIYLLQSKNDSKAKSQYKDFDYQNVLSSSSSQTKVPNYLKLPPIAVSQRNSIDTSLAIGPIPILKSNDSTPILKKQTTKFQKRFTKKTTISSIPFSVQNCVIRCSFKTRIGSIMNINKPQNQDSFIITSNLKSLKGQYLFAVCDGHGEDGHLVSDLIKQKFLVLLEKHLPETPSADKDLYKEAIKKSYSEVNDLVMKGNFDSEFSGSTFVCVLIVGAYIYCANVGDSRAVLGKHDMVWQAVDLSSDQKPNRKDESTRIIEKGGRIEAMNGLGPLRIWQKHENSPGLAMSRSIGDRAGKVVGVISEPEISHFKLVKTDKFIILASDGVWDYISSQEAVEIISKVWKKGKSELCCEVLLKESVARWQDHTESVDDITILVIFLHVKN